MIDSNKPQSGPIGNTDRTRRGRGVEGRPCTSVLSHHNQPGQSILCGARPAPYMVVTTVVIAERVWSVANWYCATCAAHALHNTVTADTLTQPGHDKL